jgi:type IV secretion system protein VirD4
MQGTNVLFGQIAVVFGIVIAGVWSATQWTAAALGYQLRLGSPWFDFSARRSITRGACSSGGSSSMPTRRASSTWAAPLRGQRPVAVLVAIGMSIWRSRQSKLVTTYGSARWANAEDIRKAGLTSRRRVPRPASPAVPAA